MSFYVNKGSSLLIWVHDHGLLRSELPYCSNQAEVWPNSIFSARVDMTVSTSVEYNGKGCNPDPNYNQDDCRLEYIHKVCNGFFLHLAI